MTHSTYLDAQLQPVATKKDRRLMAKIFDERSMRLTSIASMAARCEVSKTRKATYRFLTSHNMKIAALHKTGMHCAEFNQIKNTAIELDLVNAFPEEIHRRFQPKRYGEIREICILPTKLKAAHHMLGQVITAQLGTVDHIYSVKGRGRDALIKRAQNLINNGFGYVSHLDVKNCFSSINPTYLSKIPVHSRFVENTLRREHLNFASHTITREEQEEAIINNKSFYSTVGIVNRSGSSSLMQGSQASWPILAWAFKDLPVIDARLGFILVYVDDILVLAKSQEGCREIKHAMVQYLLNCPAGPLQLTELDYDRFQRFDFLGYEMAYHGRDKIVMPRLSDRALNKIEKALPVAVELDRKKGNNYPKEAKKMLRDILNGHRLSFDRRERYELYFDTLLDYNLNSTTPFEMVG